MASSCTFIALQRGAQEAAPTPRSAHNHSCTRPLEALLVLAQSSHQRRADCSFSSTENCWQVSGNPLPYPEKFRHLLKDTKKVDFKNVFIKLKVLFCCSLSCRICLGWTDPGKGHFHCLYIFLYWWHVRRLDLELEALSKEILERTFRRTYWALLGILFLPVMWLWTQPFF